MGRRTSTRVLCAALLAVLVAAFLGGSAAAVSFSITPGGSAVTVTISTSGDKATATFSGTAGQRVSLDITNSTIASMKISLLKPNGSAGLHGLRDEDREVRRHEHAAGERHLQARRRPEPGPHREGHAEALQRAAGRFELDDPRRARVDGDDDRARPERLLHLLRRRGATSRAQHDRRDHLRGEPHAQEPRQHASSRARRRSRRRRRSSTRSR